MGESNFQALQYASNKSLASAKGQNNVDAQEGAVENDEEQFRHQPVLRKLDKSATTNDISSIIKQRCEFCFSKEHNATRETGFAKKIGLAIIFRYIRFSNTLQVISRDTNFIGENHKLVFKSEEL